MIDVHLNYTLKDDINFILEAEKITCLEFAERTKISRTTIDAIMKTGTAGSEVCEKVYAYAYERHYRINAVKEELLKEQPGQILFHGSKDGLTTVTASGSRDNCDFGHGFYLGETYSQALSFVSEKENSSVYAFQYTAGPEKIVRFDCNLEWMIAICYFRGRINAYTSNPMVQKVVRDAEAADVIIAPIADNKMFYVMTQFTDGDINADVALHSLSASKLGLQYIFKTETALQRLTPLARYYLSIPEREDCRRALNERSFEIDTKLKLAKREYKSGLYVEELLT